MRITNIGSRNITAFPPRCEAEQRKARVDAREQRMLDAVSKVHPARCALQVIQVLKSIVKYHETEPPQ